MWNSRLFILFLVFYCSVNFGSVASAGFDLGKAKGEVKEVLQYMLNLLGDGNMNFESIDNAGDLSALTSAANAFISNEKIEALKSKGKDAQMADQMSNKFIGYQNSFLGLLHKDPETKDAEVPLAGDIANISVAWIEK